GWDGWDGAGDGHRAGACRVEVEMDVDPAGRGDHALRRPHVRVRADDERGVDGVHDLRVAGLSDTDDPPVLDADVRLDDALHRVDQKCVRDHEVERPVPGGDPAVHPEPVPEGLAAPDNALVARDEVVLFHLCPQLGITETHAVADGGSEELDVGLPAHTPRHAYAPRKPAASARSRAVFSRAALVSPSGSWFGPWTWRST